MNNLIQLIANIVVLVPATIGLVVLVWLFITYLASRHVGWRTAILWGLLTDEELEMLGLGTGEEASDE